MFPDGDDWEGGVIKMVELGSGFVEGERDHGSDLARHAEKSHSLRGWSRSEEFEEKKETAQPFITDSIYLMETETCRTDGKGYRSLR